MNLFYILGTPNRIVNSSLEFSESPVTFPGQIGIAHDADIVTYRVRGSDGGLTYHGTLSPASVSTPISQGLCNKAICSFNDEIVLVGNNSTWNTTSSLLNFKSESIIASASLDINITWFDVTRGANGYYAVGTVPGSTSISVGYSADGITWSSSTFTTTLPTTAPSIALFTSFTSCSMLPYL